MHKPTFIQKNNTHDVDHKTKNKTIKFSTITKNKYAKTDVLQTLEMVQMTAVC